MDLYLLSMSSSLKCYDLEPTLAVPGLFEQSCQIPFSKIFYFLKELSLGLSGLISKK